MYSSNASNALQRSLTIAFRPCPSWGSLMIEIRTGLPLATLRSPSGGEILGTLGWREWVAEGMRISGKGNALAVAIYFIRRADLCSGVVSR
ncbi:hypothetical protein BV898_19571 [Hypsibius exemplaris]|uniref:Uncharacterized protein n=1 Tax=Hypsibius exemplaris TaxID=2072580 RepID=A0A9X6NL58_HYPEX|nr:hypothetical protein BV898_19571 [Hypsibius exemplaris]